MIKRPLNQHVLVASGARTSSSNSGAIIATLLDIEHLLLEVRCSAASGTSPTLDIYFQESLDGGANFRDVAHFTQITASAANASYLKLHAGVLADALISATGDATISANTLGLPLLSNVWRVKWVIGGTNPSFTFFVNAYYN